MSNLAEDAASLIQARCKLASSSMAVGRGILEAVALRWGVCRDV